METVLRRPSTSQPTVYFHFTASASPPALDAEQCAELRTLAGSFDREEADRARAILLSLEGWTSFRIAEAFSVKPDSVRHWRWTFGCDGVAGLRAPEHLMS